jgi:hypothetical protein
MNLRILEEAAAEFADAIGRYESIESGFPPLPIFSPPDLLKSEA